MPMSSAYARTLVRRGKAHLYPHPAFTILQLTNIVSQPVLRPIVLGIALNYRTADFVILIDKPRSSPLSLRIIIDLSSCVAEQAKSHSRRQWTNRADAYSVHWPICKGPYLYASVLADVIATLRQVFPISHLTFIPSHQTTWWYRSVMHIVRRRIVSQWSEMAVFDQESCYVTGTNSPIPTTMLQPLLPIDGHPPQFVACSMSRTQVLVRSHQYPKHRQPIRSPILDDPTFQGRASLAGHMATIHYGGRRISGIIDRLIRHESFRFRAPVAIQASRVIWQDMLMSMQTQLQIWEPAPIAILPLHELPSK